MQEKPESISKAHLFTGRAVDQLRRQLPVVLQDDNGNSTGFYPLEGMTASIWQELRSLKAPVSLIVTEARAKYLGLKVKAGTVACLDASAMDIAQLQAMADPLASSSDIPALTSLDATDAHITAMRLVKHASLLPALVVIDNVNFPDAWLRVATSDIAAYWANPPLDVTPVAQAYLPIRETENSRIICFRDRFGTSMHMAIIIGDALAEDAPLTRIHSSCLTGDILGSLRCDCCDQLHLSLHQMADHGSGILLYLHQEGRGIGIANKLRAYALQEQGIDTYDANLMLGFGEDERDFALAAAILKSLGKTRITLLTNNPRKVENVEQYGIAVAKRLPVIAAAGRHNQAYLDTKSKKSGHLF